MTVSVVVMAHPKRRHWAEALSAELDCRVVWDEGRGMWDTGRRALLAGVATSATHHLVVQDDVILSDGLLGVLPHLRQEGATSLYVGRSKATRRAVELCRRDGTPWFRWGDLIYGPAVMHPVEWLEPLVAHGDRMTIRSYDQRLTAFSRRRRVLPWHTVPSLVEHRHGPENPSIKGGPDSRRALVFGSGVAVDWTAEPLIADRDTLTPIVEFVDEAGRRKKVRYGSSAWRSMRRRDGWHLTAESGALVEA